MPGAASIRASPPRSAPPAPGHPLLTPGSFPGIEARAPGTEPALGTTGRQFRLARSPPRLDRRGRVPSSCTHLIPRLPSRRFSPRHGPCQETAGSIGSDREQLDAPPPSPPPPRHITGLSGGNAGSWQPPPPPLRLHPSRPVLPVIASRAVATVGPSQTTTPKVHCVSVTGDVLHTTSEMHAGKRSFRCKLAHIKTR